MKYAAAAAFVVLTGCATSQVLTKEPKATFTSARSPDALSECIALALSKLGDPTVIPGDSRRIISVGSESPISTVVTIDYGMPNTISFRSAMIATDRWIERVRACA